MKSPLLALVCAFAFIVSGQVDTTGPELVSFVLHDSVFHYTDTPYVVPFTMQVSDEHSGVDYAHFLTRGQYPLSNTLIVLDGGSVITDTLRIPSEHHRLGKYSISTDLVDNAGNSSRFCGWQSNCLPFEVNFSIVDTNLNGRLPIELIDVGFQRELYQRSDTIRPEVQSNCLTGELVVVQLTMKHTELPGTKLGFRRVTDSSGTVHDWDQVRYCEGDCRLMRKGTYRLAHVRLAGTVA